MQMFQRFATKQKGSKKSWNTKTEDFQNSLLEKFRKMLIKLPLIPEQLLLLESIDKPSNAARDKAVKRSHII